MNKIVITLLPVILVGCANSVPAPAGPGDARFEAMFEKQDRVRAKVDANTGIRSYSVVPDVAESKKGKLSMASVLMASPEGSRALDVSGEFGFQTTGDHVRYRECGDLQLVVDGKALPKKSTRYFGSLGNGKVVEAVVARVTPEDVARMVSAKMVEYRLCQTRGTLTDRERNLLGQMLARYQERD